ncbi:MAG: RloB family protein [Clostridiales Family XIII bacterium]|jgi:hypothetical protein|nr:RloB family protein [Clostridiales Family XIII bacterium]
MGIKIKGEQKRRGVVNRKKRLIMLIATEGKNKTEQLYFSNFKHNSKYAIQFAKGNCTDPSNMVEGLKKQIQKEGFDKGDVAFCVFDMDADPMREKEIRELFQESEKQEFDLIISNPCFEVWFICHFSNSTKAFSDSDEVIKAVRKHINDYNKNKDIYPQLCAKTEVAIKNADSLRKHHESLGHHSGDFQANPFTAVDIIVKLLNSPKSAAT